MRIPVHSAFFYTLFLLATTNCGTHRKSEEAEPLASVPVPTPTPMPAPSPAPTPMPGPLPGTHLLAEAELRTLGWKIPSMQEKGNEVPPQVGSIIAPPPGNPFATATTVKLNGKDLPWTAFTLILYRNADSKEWEILSQLRAIRPKGALETAGGHLTAGLTWREGALEEILQETGIDKTLLKASDLIYVNEAAPSVRSSKKKGSFLVGNMNFVVVFTGEKPKTHGLSCSEINHAYGHEGHKWLPLGSDTQGFYHTVLEEQKAFIAKDPQNGRFFHGTYFSYFRGHLLAFGNQFLGWPDR